MSLAHPQRGKVTAGLQRDYKFRAFRTKRYIGGLNLYTLSHVD